MLDEGFLHVFLYAHPLGGKDTKKHHCERLLFLGIFFEELVLYTAHNRVFPAVSCLKYLLSGDNR